MYWRERNGRGCLSIYCKDWSTVCSLSHSIHMRWESVGAWDLGMARWRCRLLKHGDGLLNSLCILMSLTPPLPPSYTVYNITICIPLSLSLPFVSFSLSPLSMLGFTVCLFASWRKLLTVSVLGGESFVVFCFNFVKLMIHIVLEPPTTIKTVKSYLYCNFCFCSACPSHTWMKCFASEWF